MLPDQSPAQARRRSATPGDPDHPRRGKHLDSSPDYLDRARQQRATIRARTEKARRRHRHAVPCSACDHGIYPNDGVIVSFGHFRLHVACALCEGCGEWIGPVEASAPHASGFGRVHAACVASVTI